MGVSASFTTIYVVIIDVYMVFTNVTKGAELGVETGGRIST
jgi:hypothetical protein